ncbi:MAG: hypothetical protein IJY20_02210 [Clostridia bacterium]|nr:hypothetical protein [Clostridia bacterium]
MKRVLALLLALVTVFAMVATGVGCAGGETEEEEEDLGAEVSAILVGGEIYDFDPAKAYTNDDAMKVMSLIYEPLFTLDANGKIQYALANNYRFYDDRGEFKVDITLRETYWNDGTQVTAQDVMWSWWRILAPDFPCQASTLLYDIKNARAAKLGDDKSVEDVAVTDSEPLVLTITFERELDKDGQQNFLRNLTSIALTPVKETAVTKADRDDVWTKRVSYIVSNGPFAIREMDYGISEGEHFKTNDTPHEFRLERNPYYRMSQESTLPADTYVTPYKFVSYWNTELTESFAKFIEGSVFITGEIPLEERENYLSEAKISNLLSTYTYVLDNNDPVFANADVRRALSLVIDRQALATELTKGLSVPATGFISHGVLNGNKGSFSEVTAASDAALAATANKEEALRLLKKAKNEGYEGGSIKILVRDNKEEVAIANAIADIWEDLFDEADIYCSISVRAESYELFSIIESETEITLCKDVIQEAYRTSASDVTGFNGYNVLAIDYQMLSPDAFSALASLSLEMSGNGIYAGGLGEEFKTVSHVSGFNHEAYNKLIDQAHAATDMATRTDLLHQAEELLLSEMPVIPLFFNRSAMLVSSELKRVYTDFYGHAVLTRAELRNYHNYISTEEN